MTGKCIMFRRFANLVESDPARLSRVEGVVRASMETYPDSESQATVPSVNLSRF